MNGSDSATTHSFLKQAQLLCLKQGTIYGLLLLASTMLLISLINAIAMKATGSTSFPQSVISSCHQYYKSFWVDPLALQDELLMAAVEPSERHKYQYTRLQTQLKGRDRLINAVKIGLRNEANGSQRTIFVLHGYGSGLAFFFKVFPALLQHGNYVVHAPDWLGMGNSSRPEFVVPKHLDHDAARRWVEGWFIDSLEEYRVIHKIAKITIIAHSFGAYLAVRYAEKFPTIVEQMILISPVAVNPSPYSESVSGLVQHPPKTSIPAVYEAPEHKYGAKVASSSSAESSPQQNPLPRFIIALWEAHWTPFDFLRLAGPLGPKLCSSWSLNLPMLDNTYPSAVQTRRLIHEYTYSIFAAKASSERALSYILVAGGHARAPLEHCLPRHIPVSLIYGQKDWMSSDAGHKAAEYTNEHGGRCKVHILSTGGHLSYLEAFPELMRTIRQDLDNT